MLDSTLLQEFMHNYYGHGNLTADFWFVGMEAAGGNSERELGERLTSWKALGGGAVVDNKAFHAQIKNEKGQTLDYLFNGRPKTQATWRGLIRIFLAAQGKTDVNIEDVRSVQANDWGRDHSNNCLLELLPLSSPKTSKWKIKQWSELPELRSRKQYREALIPMRVQGLVSLIATHKPKCVIFYGKSYLDYWSEISNVNLGDSATIKVEIGEERKKKIATFGQRNQTLFGAIPHTTSHGMTNQFFAKIGETICEFISQS